MASIILTPQALVSATIAHLENDLVLGNSVHTDYSKEFKAVGDTVDVERPQRFTGQSNDLDITNYVEDLIGGKFPLQLTQTETIHFEIGVKDLTLSVKSGRIKESYIEPAVITLKDRIETHLANQYSKFWHFHGTPGTVPGTFKSLATPGAIMTDGAIPKSGRNAFHNTETGVELADSLKGVYASQKAKTAFEEATIGRYGGFHNYESVHIPDHTVGDYSGSTLVVNGANQKATYTATANTQAMDLVVDGGPNSRTGMLLKGDIITIAGVYSVNPVSKDPNSSSKKSTGRLQTFVVNTNADTDGAGNVTLNISPPIIVPVANPTTTAERTDQAFQTVTAAPADNAAITVMTGAANGVYSQSLLMPKPAISLVTRPLNIKTHGSFETSTVMGNKVSIACSKGADFKTLQAGWRFDMLFDADSMNRDHGLRLVGGGGVP